MQSTRRFIFCLIVALAVQAPSVRARPASPAPEPISQIALSEAKITQFLAATPEVKAILGTVETGPDAAPDPRVMHTLNDTARSYGFTDYADYEAVASNIVWILSGIDPLSKKYIGVPAVTRLEIANLLAADADLPPKEKKLQIAVLHAQMPNAAPVEYAANVSLVTKYYDQLVSAEAGNN